MLAYTSNRSARVHIPFQPHSVNACVHRGRLQVRCASRKGKCAEPHPRPTSAVIVTRRALLETTALSLALISQFKSAAAAFTAPPPGYRLHVDRLDGYSFFYPEDWLPVTSAGNDVFFRNPYNIEENLFVSISSPSSSRYKAVQDLGAPDAAAGKLLETYLKDEFMSTRLGIRREGSIVSATQRTAGDGKVYYDLDIRMSSYGSRNPYTTTNAEVMKDYGLEWDRILSTTLGAANQRLYELRLQSSRKDYEQAKGVYDTIRESFVCKEVEV